MKKVKKLSVSLKRVSSGMFSALSVSPTVQLGGTGALVAAVSAAPAGTENGLVTRNIPFGTQTISGTVGLGNSVNTIGFVKMTDGTNTTAVLNLAPSSDTGQSAVAVRVVSQLGAGGLVADSTGFTLGTSTFLPHGGVFNDTLAALGSGQQGTARLTAFRALHANLRDSSGVEKATVTNPSYDSIISGNGQRAIADVQGYLQVRERSSVLFYDSMPTSTLDPNRWLTNISGGSVIQSPESISVSLPATVSTYAALYSATTFSPQGLQDVMLDGLIGLPASTANAPQYFFGFGTRQSTPTVTLPVVDAIGFFYNASTGALTAAIWGNGVVKNTSATLAATLSAWNRYRVTWSGATAYLYFNDMDTPIASFTGGAPGNAGFTTNNLTTLHQAVAQSGTAVSSAFRVGAIHTGDMGRNNLQISDGNYPWRQLTIANYTSGTTVYGQVVTVDQKDTNRTNYTAYNAGVAPTTTLTLVTLTAARGGVIGASSTSLQPTAGKTLRIIGVELSIMNSTTTSGSCRILLHLINTGLVTTTSAIIGNTATNTTTSTLPNYCNSSSIAIPDGVELTGNMQFGVSLQGVATGTVYITVKGFEY